MRIVRNSLYIDIHKKICRWYMKRKSFNINNLVLLFLVASEREKLFKAYKYQYIVQEINFYSFICIQLDTYVLTIVRDYRTYDINIALKRTINITGRTITYARYFTLLVF